MNQEQRDTAAELLMILAGLADEEAKRLETTAPGRAPRFVGYAQEARDLAKTLCEGAG